MIKKREFYIVECDECDIKYDGHGEGGYTVFDEESEAKSCAISDEWIVNDKETVCCECAYKREKQA